MNNNEPFASKFRPSTLDHFIGQQHLVGSNGPIRKFIESGNIPSMLFWGPPGTGKTTLAYIISQNLFFDFYKLQAVSSGKSKLMEIIKIAMKNRDYGKKTILFLDEIHRWNKAQQDALLPYVEKGVITLIGATTENPSFSVNSALLSRSKVFTFKMQTEKDITLLLQRIIGENSDNGSILNKAKIEEDTISYIAELANGDVRSALNTLEMALTLVGTEETKPNENGKESVDLKKTSLTLTKEFVAEAIQKNLYYDKHGEEHYNLISAVHKSMRASDPDAACYWVRRMLDSGEDPLYLARRLVRFASEDIGNADPMALILANAVFEACHKLGMPECDVHLMQLATYLSNAPKSNSAYIAAQESKKDVEKFGNLPVPLHLRNAPTQLMKDLDYSKGYIYDHDVKDKKSGQQCMPDKLVGRKYL